jgi:hypothetical protein
MLGVAALALRVWAYATGRPLHSGPFILRDKGSATTRPGEIKGIEERPLLGCQFLLSAVADGE